MIEEDPKDCTLSNVIIVRSQFACRPGSLSPSLLPRIWGSRALISEVILGLCTTVCLIFSHRNGVLECPPSEDSSARLADQDPGGRGAL